MRRRSLGRAAGLLLTLVAVGGLWATQRPSQFRRHVRWTLHQLAPASVGRSITRAGAGRPVPQPASRETHPDVLLILVDTLRADHLSTYGYPRPTSPFIDSLAAGGARFERAISQAPWTIPSVLALMMGQYPSDLGFPSPSADHVSRIWPALPSTQRADGMMLAERFHDAGYKTVALSDHPGVNFNTFGRGFEVFDLLPEGPFWRWGWAETEANIVAERWKSLISRTDERPVFAYVHIYYPHAPYEPPPPFDTLFGPGALLARERSRSEIVNLYDGEIRRTDALLEQMVPAFWSQAGSSSDVITVLTSDHGEAFWDHGKEGHAETMYNELLRIPLIMHAPGRVPAGARVLEVARTVDIGQTLLDLAQIGDPADRRLRGRSLAPEMRGGSTTRDDRFAVSESPLHGSQTRAIQTGDLKIIESEGGPVAFDLASDPGEASPLSLEALPRARVLYELLATLRKHRPSTKGPAPSAPEALRGLGYFDIR